MDWELACEPRGYRFDSQSGHMPGLWAKSPVGGVQGATTHRCLSPSLSPSLPLSLKTNKILKKKKWFIESMLCIFLLCFPISFLFIWFLLFLQISFLSQEILSDLLISLYFIIVILSARYILGTLHILLHSHDDLVRLLYRWFILSELC